MKNKYKIKRLKDFPEHCKEACYAITEYGHTLFPSDVVKKLNDLELLLKQRYERSDNSDSTKCPLCKGSGIMPKANESNDIDICCTK